MTLSRCEARIAFVGYARFSLALAIVSALSGCALLDPAVRPMTPQGKEYSDVTAIALVNQICRRVVDGKPDEKPFDTCGSLEYVEGYRQVYLNASGLHSKFRNSVAWTTIPISGVALYYGLTGHAPSNNERIARFGIASAVAYSLASYSTSTAKQQIYLNGALAMSCLMAKAAPLVVPHQVLDDIESARKDLERKVKLLVDDIAKFTDDSTLSEADVIKARNARADARNAIANAVQVHAMIDGAALKIHVRADTINQSVDLQLIKEEPSLSTLMDLAKGLPTVSSGFGGSSFPTSNTSPGTTNGGNAGAQDKGQAALKSKLTEPQRKAYLSAKAQLDMQVAAVQEATAALNSRLSEVAGAASAVDTLDACSATPGMATFSVIPNDAETTIANGESADFTVPNSNQKDAIPSAEVQGSNADAITVDPIKVAGDHKTFIITVHAIKVTADNGPTLVIRDGTGSLRHDVKITVTDNGKSDAKKDDKKDNTTTQSRALNDFEKTLSPSDVRNIQCGIGMPKKDVDCKLGPLTFGYVKQFRAGDTPPQKGQEDWITQKVQEAADAKADTNFTCEDVPCPAH